MAYATSAPPRLLASAKDGSTPRLWIYQSTDPSVTVAGTSYITDGENLGMRLGDAVIVQDTNNAYASVMHTVSAISSGAVTISAAQRLAVEAGAGITNGTGTVYKSSVQRIGSIIKSSILIDLTGLNSGGTAGDVIGVNGAGAAFLGQITAERNGTILGGIMTCLETPATGDNDIDLYSADEATGVEDTAISALVETQLINSGVATAGATDALTAVPAANQYLYLVGQTGTSATYTAGIFLIELYGY